MKKKDVQVGQGREEDVFLWPIFPANWDCGNKHTYLNVRGNEVVFEWLLEHIRQNQRPTEAYVKDFVHGRIPNILIDAQSAMQVDVLKVEQQGLVCRLFDGGSIKIFPNDWVPSFVVYENTKRRCYHYYEIEERRCHRYWTWSTTPTQL